VTAPRNRVTTLAGMPIDVVASRVHGQGGAVFFTIDQGELCLARFDRKEAERLAGILFRLLSFLDGDDTAA
jgi:hypothetical protein